MQVFNCARTDREGILVSIAANICINVNPSDMTVERCLLVAVASGCCGGQWVLWCLVGAVVSSGCCGIQWVCGVQLMLWCPVGSVVASGCCGGEWVLWWRVGAVVASGCCGFEWVLWWRVSPVVARCAVVSVQLRIVQNCK